MMITPMYPRLNSIWVDKISNKLDFCMKLGNIVGDHLAKVLRIRRWLPEI